MTSVARAVAIAIGDEFLIVTLVNQPHHARQGQIVFALRVEVAASNRVKDSIDLIIDFRGFQRRDVANKVSLAHLLDRINRVRPLLSINIRKQMPEDCGWIVALLVSVVLAPASPDQLLLNPIAKRRALLCNERGG